MKSYYKNTRTKGHKFKGTQHVPLLVNNNINLDFDKPFKDDMSLTSDVEGFTSGLIEGLKRYIIVITVLRERNRKY